MDIKEKTCVLKYSELNDSEEAHAAAWIIHSIMLYPNDSERQEAYRLGLVKEVLDGFPPEGRIEIFRDNPELAEALERNGDKCKEALEHSLCHRKQRSLGSPAFRGMISGQILCLLVNPDIGSLDSAYEEIISRYKENGLNEEGFEIPSVSTLKKIWKEYKYVSHYWAAYETIYDKCSIIFDDFLDRVGNIHPQTAQHFTEFLRVSVFFRNKLTNSKINSNLQPHIKRASKAWDDEMKEESTKGWHVKYVKAAGELPMVWDVLMEDGNELLPLKLLLK
jgi:hypothetical protein